jgi:membrane-bound lytic murein transglycosylase B
MSDSTQDTTPDELMQAFRGRGLKSMLVFTLAVHAVFILTTSLPGIVKNLTSGGAGGDLTAEERAELANKEATASLREIAQRHGITPQDLSARFAPTTAARPATEPTPETAPTPTEPTPEAPKSAIEQQLETTAEGPTTPPIPNNDDEDLFK